MKRNLDLIININKDGFSMTICDPESGENSEIKHLSLNANCQNHTWAKIGSAICEWVDLWTAQLYDGGVE